MQLKQKNSSLENLFEIVKSNVAKTEFFIANHNEFFWCQQYIKYMRYIDISTYNVCMYIYIYVYIYNIYAFNRNINRNNIHVRKKFLVICDSICTCCIVKKAKTFWNYVKHFCNLVSVTKCNEVFPGQRFETQIRIQAQIRLSRILTLAIKCFTIIKITSIYTSRPFRGT